MDKFLKGKTAVVTGASRGLGRGIAVELARLGALVAINYANNEAAARETLALVEAVGGEGFLVQSELGSLESARKLATGFVIGTPAAGSWRISSRPRPRSWKKPSATISPARFT